MPESSLLPILVQNAQARRDEAEVTITARQDHLQ